MAYGVLFRLFWSLSRRIFYIQRDLIIGLGVCFIPHEMWGLGFLGLFWFITLNKGPILPIHARLLCLLISVSYLHWNYNYCFRLGVPYFSCFFTLYFRPCLSASVSVPPSIFNSSLPSLFNVCYFFTLFLQWALPAPVPFIHTVRYLLDIYRFVFTGLCMVNSLASVKFSCSSCDS